MTKFQYHIIVGLFFLALGCQNSSYNWFSGSFEEAKSQAGDKLILLDFYTDT